MKTRKIMLATLIIALLAALPRHLTYVHDPDRQGLWFNAGSVEVSAHRNIKWWQEQQNYLDYHFTVVIGQQQTLPPT